MTDAYRQPATILVGYCLEHLRTLPDCSVDSVVTDPPYGLSDHAPKEVIACLTAWLAGEPYKPKGKGFMGKSWDAWVPGPEVWRECLRVLKPGGHLVAFAGTRSMDLMAMAVRLAGFELRDAIGHAEDSGNAPLLAWSYGSGFPKSLDVSKAIDKAAGAEREVIGQGKGRTGDAAQPNGGSTFSDDSYQWPGNYDITAPTTDAARRWQGWGTALKPAWEPIILARKPLDGTVASNVLAHGTGALNIDGCRIAHETVNGGNLADNPHLRGTKRRAAPIATSFGREGDETPLTSQQGRWPANVIRDGSEEVMAAFPDAPGQQGDLTGHSRGRVSKHAYGDMKAAHDAQARGDSGSAARFFAQHQLSDDDWLWSNLSLANTAGSSLCLQNEHVASALSRAAIEALPVGSRCVVSTAPSTNVTASELRQIATVLIGTIQRTASACWHGPQHAGLIQPVSRAKAAVAHEPTGITTITVSHWKSDGSVEPVTFSITATNSEPGAKDSAERFRYCAKASRADRNDGLEGMQVFRAGERAGGRAEGSAGLATAYAGTRTPGQNIHPTVKPTDLMRWLCRLVTPPGGLVLDPFAGSGSTGRGAVLEGFDFIGIELSPEYAAIAEARLAAATEQRRIDTAQPGLFGEAA